MHNVALAFINLYFNSSFHQKTLWYLLKGLGHKMAPGKIRDDLIKNEVRVLQMGPCRQLSLKHLLLNPESHKFFSRTFSVTGKPEMHTNSNPELIIIVSF